MGCLIPKGIIACAGVLFPSHPCHQHACAFTAYDQERIKGSKRCPDLPKFLGVLKRFFAASLHAACPAAPSFLLLPAGCHPSCPAPEPSVPGPGGQPSPGRRRPCRAPRADRRARPSRAAVRPCRCWAGGRHSTACSAIRGQSGSRGSRNNNIWACKLN